jgi:hypothetical protein
MRWECDGSGSGCGNGGPGREIRARIGHARTEHHRGRNHCGAKPEEPSTGQIEFDVGFAHIPEFTGKSIDCTTVGSTSSLSGFMPLTSMQEFAFYIATVARSE